MLAQSGIKTVSYAGHGCQSIEGLGRTTVDVNKGFVKRLQEARVPECGKQSWNRRDSAYRDLGATAHLGYLCWFVFVMWNPVNVNKLTFVAQ